MKWEAFAKPQPVLIGVLVSRDVITGRTVGNAVKRAAVAAGLLQADDFTAHSLWAGHITQASMGGAPDAGIHAQSRHESD